MEPDRTDDHENENQCVSLAAPCCVICGGVYNVHQRGFVDANGDPVVTCGHCGSPFTKSNGEAWSTELAVLESRYMMWAANANKRGASTYMVESTLALILLAKKALQAARAVQAASERANDVLAWIASLDDPENLGDRATVKLQDIIALAKAAAPNSYVRPAT